jgi:hypothetical protein
MKLAITLAAAAGLASVLALPANAETAQRIDGARSTTPAVEHTDVSSQRRHYRHNHYGYRRGYHYGPRYGGYYRPYGGGYGYYGRPYAYGPGVSFGFGGGPRFGVFF